MRILIIEDEEKLAQLLKKGLEQEGFSVDYVLDGEAGQKRIELYRDEYDAVLLDLMLPKRDGIEVCKNVREKGIMVPILMLTAKDTTEDKILGLESGADDYLVKPFSFDELVARVKALLRRPHESLPQELKVRNIVLNPVTQKVYKEGREVMLTLKEFQLLEYLMRNKGRVMNREQIFSHVWDFASDAFSNVVDVHIKNLRKKLEEGSHEKFLETVRGVGYRLVE